VTAAPLWSIAMANPASMQQPAILRFASDKFMDDLKALLASAPASLSGYLAQKQSFRPRPAGAPSNWTAPISTLKLYQPAHGHFYLVAANLVCRLPGIPDHTVEARYGEKATFVLRRISPQGQEMAWTAAASGNNWAPIDAASTGKVAAGEVLQPLFPMSFTDTNNRNRRMLVGLIPTSSRETFLAAPAITPITVDTDSSGNLVDPRVVEVDNRVLDRFDDLTAPASPLNAAQQVEASQFLLLDLADFLNTRLPALWNQIANGTAPPISDPGYPLFIALAFNSVDGSSTTWAIALTQALAQWDRIGGDNPTATTVNYNLRNSALAPAVLRSSALAALAGNPVTPTPATDTPVPKLADNVQYMIRCVYQKPRCKQLAPDVVSAPTEPFALASFFDPDAPSRTIRIPLPIDTSQAGLRKFTKNVAFMMSDKLRNQMGMVSDGKSALQGNLGSDPGLQLGELCSFSIPIITLCAFIVLMIFISLLNIVFWWLPLLRICLPIKLKASS
jgi:hypothetical protein